MKFVPKPYQHLVTSHQLTHARGASWVPMGGGKSVSTLNTIDALQLAGTGPAIVVGPLRVVNSVWPDEVKKWDHLRGMDVVPIVGTVEERRRALKRDAAVHAINFENVPWLLLECSGRWRWPITVVDESTRLAGFRLRGQGTQRAGALGAIAHKYVRHWINLTGTPAPNGLEGLWGQTWFLDEGERLGRTHGAFMGRWFRPKFNGFGVEPLPHAAREIHQRVGDLCMSIDLKDYVDVREPVVKPVYVDLPPRARQIYREMERKMFTEIEGEQIEAFSAAAKTLKCLQLCNGAIYTDDQGSWAEVHDEKLQALESIMNEAGGMPVLCSYEYVSDKERILKAFPKARELDKDPQTIRDWNAGKIPLLVAHPKSAGHGLNLQDGSNILALFGNGWDLELYLQIIERIGPMRQLQSGHNRPVFIYPIVARDTLEEAVVARRDSKRSVQDVLMEAVKRRAY